ncbi:unnamed protein product [Lactuca saligna]|uniref:Uncharacterized protein n=1 Tax=Lactuca saligna TaxID=75948 RepID=A0AA36EMX7_LACSI|nr:unnamed protein product [Lactuca saligna]
MEWGNYGSWVFVVGLHVFVVRPWVFVVGPWIFVVEIWVFADRTQVVMPMRCPPLMTVGFAVVVLSRVVMGYGGEPSDDGAASRDGGGPPEDGAARVSVASNYAIGCIGLCGGSDNSPLILFVMPG